MSVTAELADGRTLEFPDGTDPSVVAATVKRLVNPGPTDTAVAVNAANKGLAGVPDMLLNAPQNVLNLGKAAFGMGANALGRPDLMPDVSPPPDFARKAMTAGGFIREDAEPTNARQRIIDSLMQGGSSMALSPAKSVPELIRNVVSGVVGGGAAQGTKEATGSDALAVTAAMAAPGTVNAIRNRAAANKAEMEVSRGMNETRDKTLSDAQDAGYKVIPADVNPSWLNKRLNSIAGKDATKQEITIQNQATRNAEAADELGFPKGTAITVDRLKAFRARESAPYREVEALSPAAGQALEDLKRARADASAQWDYYKASKHPDALAKAQALDQQADSLELTLQNIAGTAGKPELVQQLRDARQKMAKSYDIERSLNLGSSDVSGADLGRMLDNGKPLSGNLETAAKFNEAFPKVNADGARQGTPGVSKVEAIAAAMLGSGGAAAFGTPGAALAALPLLSGPIRKVYTSGAYQKAFAQPNYSPGMIDEVLSKLPPGTPPDVALQSLLLSRAVADRRGAR